MTLAPAPHLACCLNGLEICGMIPGTARKTTVPQGGK
ncbi:hypothetical protein J2X53_001525 [Pseudorhodobacter sp. 4114]|nr:hypothetical protein [Pseudorhodobacter sp. 4114]